MDVKYYQPQKADRQTPHTRDELYVIASGSGFFINGPNREKLRPERSYLFMQAPKHRFEDITSDFATWVIFYGPERGEAHS